MADPTTLLSEETEQIALEDIRDQVSAEEWAVRVDLAAAYRLVALYGWDDMIFTHLSARVPGPETHFLINPYGYMFDEITASSLVKIDIDGNVILDNGHPVNSAGFTIHSALHGAAENAHAVMHCHSNDGVAVACMESGLQPLSQTACLIQNDIAYHDYEGVALNPEEKVRLIADMGDKHILMLRNHGTLTVGASVAECFLRLYYLERACTYQVKAMSSNQLVMPNREAIEATAALATTPGVMGGIGGLAWPALLRKLDRLDPSYLQ